MALSFGVVIVDDSQPALQHYQRVILVNSVERTSRMVFDRDEALYRGSGIPAQFAHCGG